LANMRVALVIYSLNVGGVSSVVLQLARSLKRDGHSVDVVTTRSKGPWFERSDHRDVDFHHIDGFLNPLRPPAVFAHRVSAFLTRQDYDVLMVNFSPEMLLALPLLKRKPQVISVVHNDHDPICRAAMFNAPWIDWIVAVSPKVEGRCRELDPGIGNKLCTIPNGIDMALFEPEPHSTRSPADAMNVLYVGRLEHSQKGVLLIAEILAAVRDAGVSCRCTIVGDGPDRNALMKRFARQGLEPFVSYHRRLSNKEVIALYRTHDVYLMPSFYEGLPIVLLEAMASGCVPVASRLAGITDVVVEDAVDGLLVAPGDANGFAVAITRLTDSAFWASLSGAAQRKISNRFSLSSATAAYEQLFVKPNSRVGGSGFAPRGLEDLIPSFWWNIGIHSKIFLSRALRPRRDARRRGLPATRQTSSAERRTVRNRHENRLCQ
jgi:glycosyltransferase involved in cell wall biosynthesis